MNLTTPRPEPTPLTRDAVRSDHTNEFDNLDTEVGRVVTDAINQPRRHTA